MQSLVHISSLKVAGFYINLIAGIYAATKGAFVRLLHCIAAQIPVEKSRIVRFNPNAIFKGEAARYSQDSYDWDDAKYTVQWKPRSCPWDVNDLQEPEVKAQIENDDMLLLLN
ncbi:hypothetical protein EMCG_05778 [[Emmonsia] crescens]|uniref:Uncharacterized protein n=1 Tax=[Emmonsia] crescens TaxID=73230 RepID=A0A0G2JC51_9EURO|nr:hypothetical protein EMCG_05778 [Emmonsia crescens UAMH 3008]